MLQTQSLHEIQITALCQRAEIPRKAFYRYFDSKEDIITFLVEDMFQAFLRHQNYPITDRTTAIRHCTFFFQYWMERSDVLTVLCRKDTLGLFYGDFMNYIINHDLYALYGPQGMVQDRISMVLATSSLFHLLLHWSIYKVPQPAEELGQIYYNYLTNPLYPAPEGWRSP